ncbi:hypothetical protein [uncultured Corynebacterium sp.]|nr:hypothetical protein [uncultured Corynebacterium sp.]
MAFPVDEAAVIMAEEQLGRILPDALRVHRWSHETGETQPVEVQW